MLATRPSPVQDRRGDGAQNNVLETGLQNVQMTEWLVVVPARLASTRLPAKPLADLAGKPLIARVVENLAPLAREGAAIVAAVDDERTAEACRQHGINFEMTSPDLPTGTDRCAEVASRAKWADRDFILNVQGDEPFIEPADLVTLCARFSSATKTSGAHMPPAPRMASLYFRSHDPQRFVAPSTVKVVLDRYHHAIYFSRSPIPHNRDNAGKATSLFLVHMGVYAFQKACLGEFCRLPHGQLEQTEKLEQLRAVEAGWRILMCEAAKESLGIDTPEDLERARQKIAGSKSR